MTNDSSPQEAVDASLFDELSRVAGRAMQPDVDLDAMDFGLSLVRAGNRLQQDLEMHVHRPAGMTWAAFRVLFVVRSVGKSSPNEIARLSSISRASASSVLNTLQRYGMITRTRHETDGRGVEITLTPQGEAAVSELFVRNNARVMQWARLFTEDEQRTLASLLQRMLAATAPPHTDGDRPPIRTPHRASRRDEE